jgi:gamma-glutamylcyclotransferase (GGCT)/AIG2-like uncharacterized protein YtfP
MKRPSDLLRVFVYGSLKQGFTYHDDYCRGVLSIEPAAVRGLLFEHPSGFPVVKVDRDDVLAEGTEDPAADMAVQRAMGSRVCVASAQPGISAAEGLPGICPAQGSLRKASLPFGPWRLVQGELMTFDDPEVRLPALDRLEGFHPDEPTLYRRALLPVQPVSGLLVAAWVYVLGASGEDLAFLPSSSWTTGRKPL